MHGVHVGTRTTGGDRLLFEPSGFQIDLGLENGMRHIPYLFQERH
jgi:hypothetical protein